MVDNLDVDVGIATGRFCLIQGLLQFSGNSEVKVKTHSYSNFAIVSSSWTRFKLFNLLALTSTQKGVTRIFNMARQDLEPSKEINDRNGIENYLMFLF